uniref:UPAR/Ly6 domain-containing protein n=1 Tax=Parastrongyloides trichosuri TaxID=131310 RepID=A0A0N4ZCY3_PARTI
MLLKVFNFFIYVYLLILFDGGYCKKSLKCYYCGVRKKGTQNWISFNNETCRVKVVTCTKNHVACVKAKVYDHTTQFQITGCSEDKFTGCDQNELTPGGAKLERCQCETSLCNELDDHYFKNINGKEIRKSNDNTNEDGSFIVTEHSYNKLGQPFPTNKYEDDTNTKIRTNAHISYRIIITVSSLSIPLFTYAWRLLFCKYE